MSTLLGIFLLKESCLLSQNHNLQAHSNYYNYHTTLLQLTRVGGGRNLGEVSFILTICKEIILFRDLDFE